MGASVKGFGVVWGVNGVSFSGLGTLKLNSANADRTRKNKEILDGNGELAGRVFYDARVALSINVTPGDTTLTAAKTAMNSCVPMIGTEVTITDADGTLLGGANSGKYSVINTKLVRTSDNFATIDMDLETSEVNNATAAIS